MPATIGNIDLSRGQPPYNPNMGEYMVPANRSFTWESSPQEQGLLASAMGRSDLKELLNTGQWGPLAGQPYQYQGGRTTIGYGGGGGYPGGYPGGGLPPWQTGDYPPWQTGSFPPVGPAGPTRPEQPTVFTSCFVDGVQVELSDGSEKNVSEISVGDTVKTKKGDGSVIKVFHSKAGKQRLYGFNDKEPFATEAHPFMTQDGWKKISELEIGDTLYRNGLGLDTVKSIDSKEIPEDTPVYNFHVDKQENYYADGYLVHNKSYAPITPPEVTKPTTPFDTDPNKWTAPTSGGFVYDPNSVIPEFDQWSMWENQRIRDQNARIQRFQDPTSDINRNFAFEDAKRLSQLPTTPLQDKAAFMDRTDANRGRQASVMPDDFGSGNPFAARQAAAAQPQPGGIGRNTLPPLSYIPSQPTYNDPAVAWRGYQDRRALEARQPFTPIQSPAQEAAAAQRMQQQQAAGVAKRQEVARAENIRRAQASQSAAGERQRQAVTQSQQREESRGRAEQEKKAVVSKKATQQRKAIEAKSRARATAPKPAPNRQAPVRLATPTRIKPTTAGRQTGAAQRAAAKARQVAQQKAGAAKAEKSRSQAAARARNVAAEKKAKKRGKSGPGMGDR